jgi:hypothetical protein
VLTFRVKKTSRCVTWATKSVTITTADGKKTKIVAPCAAEVDVHNLLVMGLEHLEYMTGVSKTNVVVWNGKAGKTMSTTNAGWLQRAIVRDCTAEEITVLEQAAENTAKRGVLKIPSELTHERAVEPYQLRTSSRKPAQIRASESKPLSRKRTRHEHEEEITPELQSFEEKHPKRRRSSRNTELSVDKLDTKQFTELVSSIVVTAMHKEKKPSTRTLTHSRRGAGEQPPAEPEPVGTSVQSGHVTVNITINTA